MIPKIIHYCWLSGDQIPEKLQKYLDTWSKILPDYQFILWDLNKFDIKSSLWVEQAFRAKKYAFAADYIRLYALYNHGGIYLDMDVEVLKSFNAFIPLKTMLCFEKSKDKRLEMATFGTEKGSRWIKECLSYYDNREFISQDGIMDTKVLPCIISELLYKNNYKLQPVNNIKEACQIKEEKIIPVFNDEYFSPKSYGNGKITITNNTYSIHHFEGTWLPWYAKLEKYIFQCLGLTYRAILVKLIKS